MKGLIAIIIILMASINSNADPIVNDGMLHDAQEIERSVERLSPSIALGVGTGLILLGMNHALGLNEPSTDRRWYIDDSWFFLIPVGFAAYDVSHIGFHGFRIGVRFGKEI